MNSELEIAEDDEAETVDLLLTTVGWYVLAFQAVESKIEECLLLWWGHENREASKRRLAKMRNEEKVNALAEEFSANAANKRGRDRQSWATEFEALVGRLHAERKFRNELLHSHFLLELVEVGSPPLMFDTRKRARGPTALSDKFLHALIVRVDALRADMSHAHLQIVHDFNAT